MGGTGRRRNCRCRSRCIVAAQAAVAPTSGISSNSSSSRSSRCHSRGSSRNPGSGGSSVWVGPNPAAQSVHSRFCLLPVAPLFLMRTDGREAADAQLSPSRSCIGCWILLWHVAIYNSSSIAVSLMHTYKQTYIHTYVHTATYKYPCIYVYTCIHVCM